MQELKALPQSEVQEKVDEIWTEYLAPDASCPINVDSRSYEQTKKNMETPDCWSFDASAVSNTGKKKKFVDKLLIYRHMFIT